MAKKSMKGKCKVVTICRQRRRLCWGKNGLRSNTKA